MALTLRRFLPQAIEERIPTNLDYVGPSPIRAAGFQLTSLRGAVSRRVPQARQQRRLLARTRGLANRHSGKPGLLVANGASAGRLTARDLDDWRERGGLLFAVNNYCDTEFASVEPDFLTLVDPVYFVSTDTALDDTGGSHETLLNSGNKDFLDVPARVRRVWNYVAHGSFSVVMPSHQHPPIPISDGRLVHVRDGCMPGLTRNIKPWKAPGFTPLSAYFAMSIALHFGVSPLYVIGVDNSWFKFLHRTDGGELAFGPSHNGPSGSMTMGEFRGGVPAALEVFARMMASARLFPPDRVVNLDPRSLIDAFPMGSLSATVER